MGETESETERRSGVVLNTWSCVISSFDMQTIQKATDYYFYFISPISLHFPYGFRTFFDKNLETPVQNFYTFLNTIVMCNLRYLQLLYLLCRPYFQVGRWNERIWNSGNTLSIWLRVEILLCAILWYNSYFFRLSVNSGTIRFFHHI